MTIFGVIWIGALLFTLFYNKKEVVIFMVIFSSIMQSANVIVINNEGIGPQIITSCFFIIYYFIDVFKRKKLIIKKGFGLIFLSTFCLIVCIIFSSQINGVLEKNILRIIQLIIYGVTFILMYKYGSKLSKEYVYTILKKITYTILILGVIQILVTTNIIPRFGFLTELFWNDVKSAQSAAQFSSDNYFRFFSTYMEPSYFVGFAIGALWYFYCYKEKRKDNIILLIALSIVIIISFSSTGYGALILSVLIYVLLSNQRKSKIFLVVICIISAIILYFCFFGVLDAVIFSKMEGGSAAARNTWNYLAIQQFYKSPVWGMGYKTCRASSLIYTLLAEIGIVGLCVYIFFIMTLILKYIIERKKYDGNGEYTGLIFAIISVIICQIIAVPDLDICTFWMWLNLYALCCGKEKVQGLKFKQLN